MNLKPGDKVRVVDGLGNVIVPEATVTRYADGAIIFVKEPVEGGDPILYGLPISYVEPLSPGLIDVLRRYCGLRVGDGQKENTK